MCWILANPHPQSPRITNSRSESAQNVGIKNLSPGSDSKGRNWGFISLKIRTLKLDAFAVVRAKSHSTQFPGGGILTTTHRMMTYSPVITLRLEKLVSQRQKGTEDETSRRWQLHLVLIKKLLVFWKKASSLNCSFRISVPSPTQLWKLGNPAYCV